MAWRPSSAVVAALATVLASCALEASGTAPDGAGSSGAGGATATGGAGGAGGAGTTTTTTGGATTGAAGASTADGGGAAVTTGGEGGSGGGGAAGPGSGGAGGADPTCGDGTIDLGEECDGPAPCDGCAMVCPDGWTKAATGTCYGVAESEGDGDEVVDRCDGTRDQVELGDGVLLRPATPDVLADLPTVTQVCGDELGDDGCWIGADDLAVEGTFTWASGEAFAYDGGLSPWAEGEPTGDDDDESCVEVYAPEGGDRPLHDDDCWRTQRVICEIVPPGVPAGG